MPQQRTGDLRWQRILGRLRRLQTMAQPYQPPGGSTNPGTLPQGIDVHPGMDRGIGPTDPEVYSAAPRQPTPLPSRHMPPVPPITTPTSDILREILDAMDRNPTQTAEMARVMDTTIPATATTSGYINAAPNPTEVTSSYVEMRPIMTVVPSRPPPELTSRPLPELPTQNAPPPSQTSSMAVSPASPPRLADVQEAEAPPTQHYDELPPPSATRHPHTERRPIPQGSPTLARPREAMVPLYYRDYLIYEAIPAYHFICHSSWYVQVTEQMIFCPECATSEHALCAANRSRATWRHIHIIARNFHHTSLHCGRCYKLVLYTKRAIDCYHCRKYIIENYRQVQRLVYHVLCDSTT